jgi:hypothetical protein
MHETAIRGPPGGRPVSEKRQGIPRRTNGGEQMTAFSPTEPIPTGIANGKDGALPAGLIRAARLIVVGAKAVTRPTLQQ